MDNTESKRVKVLDKTFRHYISRDEIAAAVDRIAGEIERDLKVRNPVFICMLNGAFIFAADLIRRMEGAQELRFVKLSSYSGTQSTGKVKTALPLEADITGRDVIIVEDIIETGGTMHHFIGELREKHPASISIATLVTKPERLQYPLEIKYTGFRMKASDFIVGYGMDYEQYGRNLPDIYIIEE